MCGMRCCAVRSRCQNCFPMRHMRYIKGMEICFSKGEKGAAEDLKRLEKMQKKGHENGKEYNAMHKALKELAEFKVDEGSYETLQTKLENLKTASEGYADTHDKWYKASKGYGLDRLDMARHLKEMTEQAELRLKDFPKACQDRLLGTLADELAKEKLC